MEFREPRRRTSPPVSSGEPDFEAQAGSGGSHQSQGESRERREGDELETELDTVQQAEGESPEQFDVNELETELQRAQQAHQEAQAEATNAVRARNGDFSHVREAVAALKTTRDATEQVKKRHKQLEKEATEARKNEQKATTALLNAERNNDRTVEEKRREKRAASQRTRRAERRANRASTVATETEDLVKETKKLAKTAAQSSRCLPPGSWNNSIRATLGNISIGFSKGMAIGGMIRPHQTPITSPAAMIGGGFGGILSALSMPGFSCPTCGSLNTSGINGNLISTLGLSLVGNGVLHEMDIEENYAPGIGSAGGLLISALDYRSLSRANCNVCHDDWNVFKHAGTQE